MDQVADEAAAREAREFAAALAARWKGEMGAGLIGIYLIGSLAHGGFSRRYSDIDVAVITESGLSLPLLEQMRRDAASVSSALAPKISIFWTDRTFSVGRFPPLDRIDYLDHAIALFEHDRLEAQRPSVMDVRRYLAGEPFANWKEAARTFSGSDRLDPKDRKSYLRALLYPARLIFSWSSGRMASNDVAVAYVAERAPEGLEVGLLQSALDCRQSAADPDPLFSARSVLPRQVAACEAAMARES